MTGKWMGGQRKSCQASPGTDEGVSIFRQPCSLRLWTELFLEMETPISQIPRLYSRRTKSGQSVPLKLLIRVFIRRFLVYVWSLWLGHALARSGGQRCICWWQKSCTRLLLLYNDHVGLLYRLWLSSMIPPQRLSLCCEVENGRECEWKTSNRHFRYPRCYLLWGLACSSQWFYKLQQ